MKLRTSVKIILFLILFFLIAIAVISVELYSISKENKNLKATINDFANTVEVPVEQTCTTEETVVYDIDSLEKALDKAAQTVIKDK